MIESTWLLIVAAIIVGMILIVPQVLRLRIKVFCFLHWRWLANWHQDHFGGLVIAARIILAVIAAILVWIANEMKPVV